MKKWKKKSALLLSVVLAASAFMAGCGGKEATVNNGQTAAGANQEVAEQSGKKIADGETLTIFCDLQTAARAYYTDLSENPVVQYMEKETGLNLEFVHAPAGDDGTYFQNMLASGDLPDIMATSLFSTTYPGGVEGAIADGVLYDVTELVEKNAVNFKALCDSANDPEMDRKIRGDEGKIIKFGTKFNPPTCNNKCFNGLIVRQDWLEKYNLEAPVTLDDYTNVLRTFKENGVEIPLALCKFDQPQFYANNPIASAFDVSIQDFDIDDDGNVHYSRTKDGYKEFLAVLNQWAEEGLIDTDFVSRTIDDSLKLFNNGTAGMTFAHTYNVKESVAAGPAIDPNFKLLCLEMPKKNAGDTTHMSSYTQSVNTFSYQVSAECKHPEIAVAFIDYLMDPETMLMTAWGTNEEVETWRLNDKGVREFTEFVTNNPDKLDYNTVRSLYMCTELQMQYDETMEATQYSLDECHQSWDAWGAQNDGAHCLPRYMTLTTDESKELTQIKSKLANYSDEKVYRFIFGEADLDAEWDEFVKQCKELGSERGEEINKAAYDRYLQRQQYKNIRQ